jgi:hypothetical protein
MRLLGILLVLCVWAEMMSGLPGHRADAQTVPAASSDNAQRGSGENFQQQKEAFGQAIRTSGSAIQAATTPWKIVSELPWWAVIVAVVAVVLVIGLGLLLRNATASLPVPSILQLGPSFFFWLGMGYTSLLLLMAAAYNTWFAGTGGSKPVLLGGILPIAVPWFGALGAVTISLEGVFLWNSQWDTKFNYWHIGRPIFGAVLGIVAFFLFVLIVTTSGTPPKFLTGGATESKDLIIYYVVAFLVGYREETFRDLIKRATDLILRPAAQPISGPAVTFKVAGVTQSRISFPHTTVGNTSPVTVQVQNAGSAPLNAPAVAVTTTAPAAVATFGTANDLVTGGGDLAPGQVRNVDVTFTPQVAGNLAGTLTVTATNLTAPRLIGVSGTA